MSILSIHSRPYLLFAAGNKRLDSIQILTGDLADLYETLAFEEMKRKNFLIDQRQFKEMLLDLLELLVPGEFFFRRDIV